MERLRADRRGFMIRRILEMLNNLAGLVFKLKQGVTVGPNSKVAWPRIRLPKGAQLTIGKDSLVHCRISFDSNSGHVKIGDRSFVGLSSLVCYRSIVIGNDVMISWGATIVDHDSHSIYWDERKDDVINWSVGIKNWEHVTTAPVIIHDKAWIGFNVSILKGVTIGEGAVVGACSVVTKSVPPYTLVAGNPARAIRQLQPQRES